MNTGTQASAGPVNTGKIPGRRLLHFETIDQALAEADRLAEAERAGLLKRWATGRWVRQWVTWPPGRSTPIPARP
jgi:hypothetical protein